MDENEDALDVTGDDQEVARSNYEFGGYDVGEIVNPAAEGQEGYGWRYYTNGTAVSPEGEVYASDASGTPFSLKSVLGSAWDQVKSAFTTNGVTDWGKVAALGYGAYQALNPPAQQKAGYQGGIPDLVANRQQIQYTDPERRPGSGGRQYFTDTIYTKGTPATMTTEQAKAAGAAQAAGILGAYKGAGSSLPEKGTVPTKQTATDRPTSVIDTGMGTTAGTESGTTIATNQPVSQYEPGVGTVGTTATQTTTTPTKVEDQNITRDSGIQTGFAKGGAPGRYLRGDTDGMADELEASIDGEQPAALSHGEFVIPADVVSHIGNGNSDAGVKKLYQMMSAVRKARTGTEKQGKRINPDKFLPGGDVKKFEVGGAVSTATTVPTVPGMPTIGTESSLSNWAGPYVTDMLAKGKALAESPYEAYTGPLTAGTSPLQAQAMQGLGGLSVPTSIGAGAATAGQVAQKAGGMGYTPTTFTSGYTAPAAYQTGQFTTGEFDTSAAQKYINPYVQTALNPQLEEMKRQSDIARMSDAARLTKAGAYGGSRQAIMESEGRRNLLGRQTEAIGTGYSSAFDKAMAQFNQDQARQMQVQQAGEQSRQYGYGQNMQQAQAQQQAGMQAQQASEASRQYGSQFGLNALQQQLAAAQAQSGMGQQEQSAGLALLAAQMGAGGAQRAIEAEGIAADKAQFEEQRDNPINRLLFQQSLLKGLPLEAQTTLTQQPSTLSNLAGGVSSASQFINALYPGTTTTK